MLRSQRIEHLLRQALTALEVLTIENESHRHHVPEGSETHFKLTLVSASFQDTSLLTRQRHINALLKDEFASGLHALSMHLFTPDEWVKKSQKTMASPQCKDGYKHKKP